MPLPPASAMPAAAPAPRSFGLQFTSRFGLVFGRPAGPLSSPEHTAAASSAGDAGAGFSLTANEEKLDRGPPTPPPGPPRALARRSCAPSSNRRRRATKESVMDDDDDGGVNGGVNGGVDDVSFVDPNFFSPDEEGPKEGEEAEDLVSFGGGGGGGGGGASSKACALKPASPSRTAVRAPTVCFGAREVMAPVPVLEDAAESSGEVTTRASSFFAKEPSTWAGFLEDEGGGEKSGDRFCCSSLFGICVNV